MSIQSEYYESLNYETFEEMYRHHIDLSDVCFKEYTDSNGRNQMALEKSENDNYTAQYIKQMAYTKYRIILPYQKARVETERFVQGSPSFDEVKNVIEGVTSYDHIIEARAMVVKFKVTSAAPQPAHFVLAELLAKKEAEISKR